ncbi:MAG: hypothetical protein NT133_18040 [Alphaproteobacteria bacterium]|nr:hypothetical protein [Alphaproteobacteria bacterium]
MILVFEMNWSGTVHAPGNAATIQAIAAGCPDQEVRVFAEPGHLQELRLDSIAGHPIALYPQFQGRPGIVAWRRMRHEFALLRAALAAVPAGEPCLLMLLSTTSTAIFATALAARLRPGTRAQIGLHGDLNALTGSRSRHPLRRAFDLHAAMARPWRHLRFLVLEDAIRDELARLAPSALPRTDVLPLPINAAELPVEPAATLAPPIRFGFVGQATEAKGITSFLAIARTMKSRHGAAAEFDVIGRADPRHPPPDASDLIAPIATDYLARAEFTRRLAALHYVVLPLQGAYYRLAASGALLDAVTWLKPVIAGQVPIVAPWFTHGDIGHLCADEAEMLAAIDAILTWPDPERYAAQVATMRIARDTRSPAATGQRYSALMRGFFPP